MTVASELVRSGPYYPNGATVAFPFTFRAISATDVEFVRVNADGSTTTISNALYAVTLSGEGGTVTFTSPLSASTLPHYVQMSPSFKQGISFQDQGAYLPSVLTEALDRDAQRDLWLRDQLRRSLKVPPGETAPNLVGLSSGEGKLLQLSGGKLIPAIDPDAAVLVAANEALALAQSAVASISGALSPVTRYAPRPRRWAAPAGMNNPLGLAIDCDGARYSFSSDPYALNDWTNGVTGITHLYVSPASGNDANPGTSPGSPWKSLEKVQTSAPDKSVIHYLDPTVFYEEAFAGSYDFGTRRIKIISDVSVGTVFTTWRRSYNLAYLSWVADGSAYKTTAAISGATVQSMVDRKYLDIWGLPRPMQYVASSTLVKATPGTWYWDNGTGTLWVSMIDGRVPDPATGWTPITSFGGYNFLSDTDLVFENLEFGYNGGGANSNAFRFRPTTPFVQNNIRLGLKKIKGWGADGNAFSIYDVKTAVFQQCAGSDCMFDIFNYSSFISQAMSPTRAQWMTVYEDGCHGHNPGSTIGKVNTPYSNSNNITTAHASMHVYRVNTSGYGCPNGWLAEVNGCYSMNAGVRCNESTKTGGMYLQNFFSQKLAGEGSAGSKMVLIGCAGEAFSAGRAVFSNWDDTDTVATLGEIHVADWLGSAASSRKLGTIIKNYETGAAL